MNFKDHFSGQASDYAKYRPGYPPELFYYLTTLCRERKTAWDCGTGNGQAALRLAEHFRTVIATDPSEKQIKNAVPHERIFYQVSPAERTSIERSTVDLVTVAQAVHWFNFPEFYKEVRRVGKPGGILAVWCYGLLKVSAEIDAVIDRFYSDTAGAYWPPERKWIDENYRTLPFPFQEIAPPPFSMSDEWDLLEMQGYLSTWSAVQQFIKVNSFNPIDGLVEKLQSVWGTESQKRKITWPLHLRIGKILP